VLFRLIVQHLFEGFDAHAGLLRTNVLDIEAEDARELGEVVDVAASCQKLEHIAVLDRRALLFV